MMINGEAMDWKMVNKLPNTLLSTSARALFSDVVLAPPKLFPNKGLNSTTQNSKLTVDKGGSKKQERKRGNLETVIISLQTASWFSCVNLII